MSSLISCAQPKYVINDSISIVSCSQSMNGARVNEMKDKDTTLQCVSLGCQPIIRCCIGRIRPGLASKAVLLCQFF